MNWIIVENEVVGYYMTSRNGKAHEIRDFSKNKFQSSEKT